MSILKREFCCGKKWAKLRGGGGIIYRRDNPLSAHHTDIKRKYFGSRFYSKDLKPYFVFTLARKYDARLVTSNTKDFPIKSFIVTPAEMMEIIDGKQKK